MALWLPCRAEYLDPSELITCWRQPRHLSTLPDALGRQQGRLPPATASLAKDRILHTKSGQIWGRRVHRNGHSSQGTSTHASWRASGASLDTGASTAGTTSEDDHPQRTAKPTQGQGPCFLQRRMALWLPCRAEYLDPSELITCWRQPRHLSTLPEALGRQQGRLPPATASLAKDRNLHTKSGQIWGRRVHWNGHSSQGTSTQASCRLSFNHFKP